MTALLEARHVTKIFGGGRFAKTAGTVALDDFSFRVDAEPPTITAIVGESGSGKTTLARLLLGLAAPTSGEVLYRGRNLQSLSREERQRIMVARALLLQPRLIIADEPVSMVDASLRATILESLRQLHLNFGISLLYITHDLTTAYQISQNILVMYRGEVAEAGNVDLVVKDPRHPYTQLLIQSIPKADPEHPWQGHELPVDPSAPVTAVTHGCKFADRCPYAMEISRQQRPPLFRTDERRAAAC